MIIGREQTEFYFQQPKIRSRLLGIYIWLFGFPDLHTQIRFRAIRRYLKRNLKTIELGASRGIMAWAISRFLKQPITALVYEQADLEAAKLISGSNQVNFIQGDITDLNNFQEKFEQILIIDVLEHVDDLGALKQVVKIAKPDSILIISVPTPNYPKVFGEEFAHSIGHLRPGYFLADLSSILKINGFKVIAHHYYTGLVSQFFCKIIFNFFKNNRYINWLFYPIFNLICLFDFWGNDERAASLVVVAQKYGKNFKKN